MEIMNRKAAKKKTTMFRFQAFNPAIRTESLPYFSHQGIAGS